MAWQARMGLAGRGMATQARSGAARRGMEWQGMARQARQGGSCSGLFFFPSMIPYRQRGEDSRFHRGNVQFRHHRQQNFPTEFLVVVT